MNKIRNIYNKIIELEDLSPSPLVNEIFTELVDLVKQLDSTEELTIKEISNLQKICAESEYLMEKYWANEIINAPKPLEKLREFVYYKNYLDLTKLEWLNISACNVHSWHDIIFCGGGPLPMTAIILAIEFDLNSTVLDIDRDACILAQKVIQKLGLGNKIKIINSDASKFSNYGQFNTIFVAALAGIDSKTKKKILNKIKTDTEPHTHVLARSAWGGRKYLYKPIEKEEYANFNRILEIHPNNDIINSFLIFST